MQHGLILRFDSGSVRENEYFSNKFAVDLWLGRNVAFRGIWFMEDDHSLPDVFAANVTKGERARLSSTAARNGDAFAFDRADFRRRELTKAIGTYKNGVTGMNNAAFDDAGNHGANKRNREGIVDMEFKGCIGVVVAVMGEDV